jgi:hypothetical protein
VLEILDSDHLPILFYMLYHVSTRDILAPIKIFIAPAYRLSTHKITLSNLKEELPELERHRQIKNRLRKLWQETRDPASKTALNWVTKIVRRMTQKRLKEQWDTKMGNCEVTPQAMWPMAKAMLNRDAPKAPTVIHGYSGLKFLPLEKVNAIADSLEIRRTQHIPV